MTSSGIEIKSYEQAEYFINAENRIAYNELNYKKYSVNISSLKLIANELPIIQFDSNVAKVAFKNVPRGFKWEYPLTGGIQQSFDLDTIYDEYEKLSKMVEISSRFAIWAKRVTRGTSVTLKITIHPKVEMEEFEIVIANDLSIAGANYISEKSSKRLDYSLIVHPTKAVHLSNLVREFHRAHGCKIFIMRDFEIKQY
jgi:hypothetical protein